jgi:hypothetical protein
MKTLPYYSVRNSKIHGRGVFAKRPIRKGIRIIEYTGPIVSTEEADVIGVQNENGHSHTMLFEIDKDRVINGNAGGDARYLNHGCDPNCETVQDGDRIFIEALRGIKQGEELCYDYHLQVPGKITDKVRKEYACFCGSPKCRGTQIAPDLLAKQAKKDEKKAEKKAKAEAKAKEKTENKAKAKSEAKLKEKTKTKDGLKKSKAKPEDKAKTEKKAKAETKVKSEVKAKAKTDVKKAEGKKKTEGKLSKKDKKKSKKKLASSSLMVETAGLSNKNKKKDKKKK